MSHLTKLLILLIFLSSPMLRLSGQTPGICPLYIKLVDAVSGAEVPQFSLAIAEDNKPATPYQSDNSGLIAMLLSDRTNTLVIQYTETDTIILNKKFCNSTIVIPIVNEQNLSEVRVTGFLNESSRKEIPASIGLITNQTINGTDKTSLQNSLNTIPGVSMESRGYGGSQRISIRGSSLRAPFAIRNIKMYVDGIPFTSPDGQSPLELIDAADVSSVEVIKGPAGSVWGSGNGGVLLFKTNHATPGETSVSQSVQAGASGLYRSNTALNIGLKKGGIRISHIYQDNRGYRTQESNHKNQVSISGRHYLNENHSLSHYHNYYNGRWDLPGGLNKNESEADPTQANAFSHRINAGVKRERWMSAIAHRWKMNRYLSLNSSVYLYLTDKINPYGTSAFNSGYKVENANGTGGRMELNYNRQLTKFLSLAIHSGVELQQENYHITEKTISYSGPGSVRYIYDIIYLNEMYFLSSDLRIGNNAYINAGISYNNLRQEITGNTSSGFSYDTDNTLGYKALPRIAVSLRIINEHYLFAGRSFGNSNPTAFEMVDYENNAFNPGLKPEKGMNDEAGIKGVFGNSAISYELSVYQFKLTNAILSYNKIIEGENGTEDLIVLYGNSGSTIQRGLEWAISKKFLQKNSDFNFSIFLNGTIQHYKFNRYAVNGENIEGDQIPGIPVNTINAGVQITAFNKLNADFFLYSNNRIPLTYDNSVKADPLFLTNARLSYDIKFSKATLRIFAGVNNLLNTSYSAFYNLNAPNGRYYNPAPGLNGFGGIELIMKCKPRVSKTE